MNDGNSAEPNCVGTSQRISQRSSLRETHPVVTPRDRAVLKEVGLLYGLPLWLLGYFLTERSDQIPLSESGTRQQVQRWLAMGLVFRKRRLGRTWVSLTKAGYDLVGLSFPLWAMPLTRVTHVAAVAATKLWWEQSPARLTEQGPWITERTLFSQRGRNDWHVPDGSICNERTGTSMSVEIELHIKQPTSRYVTEIFGRLSPDVKAVLYLCPDEMVERLSTLALRSVAQVGLQNDVRVFTRPLPGLAARTLQQGGQS